MQIIECSASFARPNDTTQYASGDLIANSTTAGSVTPLTFNIPYGRGLKIHRVSVAKTSTTVTDAQFRLHLYTSSPTVANGDNGAISSSVSGYLGYIDIDGQAPAMTGGSKAYGVYVNNSVFAPLLAYVGVDYKLYGLLEARDTYTPTASETITVSLLGEAYQ